MLTGDSRAADGERRGRKASKEGTDWREGHQPLPVLASPTQRVTIEAEGGARGTYGIVGWKDKGEGRGWAKGSAAWGKSESDATDRTGGEARACISNVPRFGTLKRHLAKRDETSLFADDNHQPPSLIDPHA